MAVLIVIAVFAVALIALLIQPGTPGRQCESLQECVQNANVYGDYGAVFYDSYSSPGGTAATKRTYTISNDQLNQCTGCSMIYTSGYGNSTGNCTGGSFDCSSIMKQTDILEIARSMNVSAEFRLGSRQCFRGRITSAEPFDAVVCFDETNRITNYAEQGKRPFFRFSIAGYETDLPFS